MEAMAIDTAGDKPVANTSAPHLDGILLLEAPFAKVPFDELRRQQKTQQRLIERELVFASTTFNDLSKSLSPSSSSSSAAEVEKSLDAVLGRLKGLKRKLAPLSDAAKTSLKMAQSRTDHLHRLHQITDVESSDFGEWSKTRLDRMIVDYMLRRGYRESAQEMAQSRGIGELVDLTLFDEVARIEESLYPPGWEGGQGEEKPSCGLALAWCSENKATLRKIRTPLEFNLRLQEFVELTRVRTTESIKEAIAYARRHLLPLINSDPPPAASTSVKPTTQAEKEAEYDRLAASAMRKEISRALGLLACGPSSWAYADLYSLQRWSALRDSFRAVALQIHSLPPQPILHIALSAGLSSLKLPQCYSHPLPPKADDPDAKRDGSNVDCPICDHEGLGLLAKEVPWSHHQNSTLVCSHSGRLMDENDPPLALPNGRVYAQSSLLEMLHDGQIVCARTGDTARIDQVRKLYIS